MINTSDNNTDTNDRVAAILISPDRKMFLAGKAPNRKYDLDDLVGKGHIEEGEDPNITLAREVFEEANIDITKLTPVLVDKIKYQSGLMFCYAVVLPEIPQNIKCNSEFTDFRGIDLPEFESFEWVNLSDWSTKLYKSLQKVCEPVFEKIIEWIKKGIL